MGYGLDCRDRIPAGVRNFYSIQNPDRLWGPANLLCNEYRSFSPEVKRLEHEANQSLSSSTEAKNGGAIPPLPNMSSWNSV
jgi:hypothetical protein